MEKPTEAYASHFKYLLLDDNTTVDILHSKVIEVYFIGVDNLLASSLAAPVYENPKETWGWSWNQFGTNTLRIAMGSLKVFQLIEAVLGY